MTTNSLLKIAVGIDDFKWHKKFSTTLDELIKNDYKIEYKVINLDCDDWIDQLLPFDLLIWKPACLSIEPVSYFKEKIYFIENYLNKLVVPNFKTIWHYDSKIAQSYLFKVFNVPTPRTIATFNFLDAIEQLSGSSMPIVYKSSWGAASKNVRLIKDKKTARRELENEFFQQLWELAKSNETSLAKMVISTIARPWFWKKTMQKIKGFKSFSERYGVAYWQQFVENNNADLRITVIGNKYAYGFWRNNRKNDFRASGSGLIDYHRSIPENVIRECIHINSDLDFDSMAYDILFNREKFVISEISYAYVDEALYKCDGHYELLDTGQIDYVAGNIWPQELWVLWALKRACYIP